MKKLLLVCTFLTLTFIFWGCSGTPTPSGDTDVPRYTEDQVLEKAKTRSDVGLDSHIEWAWKVVYLPAQPELKLKGVWKVEQTGLDMNDSPVSQITYFSEDTGKFTYVR